MSYVFVPIVGSDYKLVDEWNPEMEWTRRNLVLFRALKLTGNKKVSLGRRLEFDENSRIKLDEHGNRVYTEVYVNRVAMNPLFKDDDGSMVPVVVSFPAGTVFELSEYKVGYRGLIREVWLKVKSSSDSRLTGRVLSVTPEQFNAVELEEE